MTQCHVAVEQLRPRQVGHGIADPYEPPDRRFRRFGRCDTPALAPGFCVELDTDVIGKAGRLSLAHAPRVAMPPDQRDHTDLCLYRAVEDVCRFGRDKVVDIEIGHRARIAQKPRAQDFI